jgi:isopropylmalate/homocitrate/citramalate synthase
VPQNTAADQVGEYAKNALYMTIGLGVLAIEQVQVQRRQLVDWLSGQATELRGSLEAMQSRIEDTVNAAEERVTAFEEHAEALLTEVQGRLPESVKDLAEQSIDYATQAQAKVFDLVGFTSTKPPKSAKTTGTTKAA